ncbi:alpha/beta hydrolase [Isoptericola cucumis]|uniref:Alpha/beta hydrolase n=1 Tax=Isoptericola cucumis TaxID=1776856 RepID=A0ABQ2B4F8_9MICO|nr:alpha/beta hydrolase [Isoptericola cucumis]GGI04926.1 alpha/beta hydrolase [Isoptericola cucumis]
MPDRPEPARGAWRPDVLGPDFEARTLPLPGGAEATLVRHVPSTPDGPGDDPARVAVLYVHGFVDYFFHPHVARAVADRGHAFYAVDLRGHGRSLAAHTAAGHDPNLVTDLALYAQDLDAAAAVVRGAGHERLVVLGHSTGGLIAPLWANGRPGRADALVLNSPWLELNEGWFERVPATWAIDVGGRVAPRLVVGRLGEHYGGALHRTTGGAWDYDLAWKPREGFPVRSAWLRTVRRAHRRVARGLDLTIPVLVLTSARSGPARRWHPELVTTDSVLDVAQIADRAPRLGTDVTLVPVPGGAHDLALSPEPARSAYLSAVLDWVDTHVP